MQAGDAVPHKCDNSRDIFAPDAYLSKAGKDFWNPLVQNNTDAAHGGDLTTCFCLNFVSGHWTGKNI